MSNPPPPSIPGGTPPPPTPPPAPAAPSVPQPAAPPAAPSVSGVPAPAAPPAAAAPTIPLRPAGLGGGIKLGGGLKTVALGSATTPVAPAAAAPTVPLTPPGAGMATAQLPQATIGLNTAPAAAPVSSASFTAKKFEQDSEEGSNTLLNVLSFVALAFALAFVGYQYATDTLESRSMTGWLGSEEKPAAAAPAAASGQSADDAASEEEAETSDEAAADAPADDASSDVADDEE